MIDWSTWEIFFSRAGLIASQLFFVRHKKKAVSQTRLMPQADTSLRLDWNQKTGTQAGCDWPHARHTVVLYHLLCSFLQKCSFLWIYQRKWPWLSLRTLLSLKGSSLEVFARVRQTFRIPSTAEKSWFFHVYWVFSGTLLGHRPVQFHSCHFALTFPVQHWWLRNAMWEKFKWGVTTEQIPNCKETYCHTYWIRQC